jgi:hypothetical protein
LRSHRLGETAVFRYWNSLKGQGSERQQGFFQMVEAIVMANDGLSHLILAQ